MRALLAAAIIVCGAAPALAVPYCELPRGPGVTLNFQLQIGRLSEQERAQLAEQELNARGVEAQQTRFWNGCIQTFVRENGHVSMRFYDPYTFEEVF